MSSEASAVNNRECAGIEAFNTDISALSGKPDHGPENVETLMSMTELAAECADHEAEPLL
jgi:hypothetical protein